MVASRTLLTPAPVSGLCWRGPLSELRLSRVLGSSHPSILCGGISYVEFERSKPFLHKTLSGAERWDGANFALTEFHEVVRDQSVGR